MRIERIGDERENDRRRIRADVVWEDRDARTRSLTIDTIAPFGDDLAPSPDVFLLALAPLAQWHGERRIHVEGTVCCRLRDGLRAALDLFTFWHERCRPLVVEAADGFAPTVARREPRAASFLSGGIDALSLLRCNRLDYPPGHARSIRDCLVVFGLNSHDLTASGPRPERVDAFERHVRRMTPFAEVAGAELIPVYTSIRSFYADFESWAAVGFGAGIASIALAMRGRLDRVELASAGLGMRQPPRATHPWLDHHFSTDAVAVHHAQAALSRFDKTRIVSDWPEALPVVRSCLYEKIPPAGWVNCGECDKCIRTMLAPLTALNALRRTPAFPFDEVTPAMIESVRIEDRLGLLYYIQCAEALEALGRDDLATPLRRKISAYRRGESRRRLLRLAGWRAQ